MNINTVKAVEDLTWAVLDGSVAKAAAEPDTGKLKSLFAVILAKNQNHHELEDQMPEPM